MSELSSHIHLRESQDSLSVIKQRESEVKDFESKIVVALSDFSSKPLETRHDVVLSLLEDLAGRLPYGYAPILLTLHEHLRLIHNSSATQLNASTQKL